MGGLLPKPNEVRKKTFGVKDTAEEARLGAVCDIVHDQDKQVGCGVLVYDQHVNVNSPTHAQLSNYCIITSTKVIENCNNVSKYKIVFSQKSKPFHLQRITKSIRKTNSGLVIIFVDDCHKDFQHRNKLCSTLLKSPLSIANCAQLQQRSFCYIANKRYCIKSGGEDGVYILEAALNNPGTSGESAYVPVEMQNGTVILQGAENDVKAVGVFNVVDKTEMKISPIWLESRIMDILEDSPTPTPDQPDSAPLPAPSPNVSDNAPVDAAATSSFTTNEPAQTLSGSTDGQTLNSPTAEPHNPASSEDMVPVPNVESPPPPFNEVPAPGSDTADAPDGAAAASSTSTTDPPETLPDSTNGQASNSATAPCNQILAPVSDDVVSADDKPLLERLATGLDQTPFRCISGWERLACTKEIKAPLHVRLRCKIHTEKSCTLTLFEKFTAECVDMTLKDMVDALINIVRHDVKRIITGAYPNSEDWKMKFTEFACDKGDLISQMANYLDQKSQVIKNWRHLGYYFKYSSESMDEIELGLSTQILMEYLYTTRAELTIGLFHDKVNELERDDVPKRLKTFMEEKKIGRDTPMKEVIHLNDDDNMRYICACLNKSIPGVKNWRKLAKLFDVPEDMYKECEPSRPKSSTDTLFEWIFAEKDPPLTKGQLCSALKNIGRFDLEKAVKVYFVKKSNRSNTHPGY